MFEFGFVVFVDVLIDLIKDMFEVMFMVDVVDVLM